MHEYLLSLRPLLLNQIARWAKNRKQIFGRFIVFIESRCHDAHVQMLLERRGRQVGAHDCEHESNVRGAEGVDVRRG